MRMSMTGDRRRWLVLLVVTALGLTLLGTAASSASATAPTKPNKPKKPEVSLSAPATGQVGTAIQVKAVVKRGVKGQKVTLQRQVGATWAKVAEAKLPSAGKNKKTVTFAVTPAAAGTQVYRASLAKKNATKAATSKTIQVAVTQPPVEPPVSDAVVTLTPSTSTTGAYGSEQTKVTFSGTVTKVAPGTQVQIQYARGQHPAAGAWSTATTVTTVGDASPLTYSGTVNIPVDRAGVVGAPQLNLRAVVGSAVSPTKSYLVRTRYDGIYNQYDDQGQIIAGTENTFQVFYSSKQWQMNFSGIPPVVGATDGWDLVDSGGLRLEATLNGLNSDGLPTITYVATFTTSGGEQRQIRGTATFN